MASDADAIAQGAKFTGAIFKGVSSFLDADRREEFEETKHANIVATQNRLEAAQRRKEGLISARQRARARAEARRKTAQGVSLAINTGAGGAIGATGSTLPGLIGNLQNQLNLQTAFSTQVDESNSRIRSAFSQIQDAQQVQDKGPTGLALGLDIFGSLLQGQAPFIGRQGKKGADATGAAIDATGAAIGDFFSDSLIDRRDVSEGGSGPIINTGAFQDDNE